MNVLILTNFITGTMFQNYTKQGGQVILPDFETRQDVSCQ